MPDNALTDLASLVGQVRVPSLVDAIGRLFPHRAHVEELQSPAPDRILFGPAAIISYIPVRKDLYDEEQHTFARLFYEAIGDAPEGKVLVLGASGCREVSVGGGTKLARADLKRLAGVLTDGCLRDFDELAESPRAFYCHAETFRWGGDKLMPFAVNIPVVLDGVTVIPGDYVYAAGTGAVIIPASGVHQVLAEAIGIEKADAEYIEQIRQEDAGEIRRQGSER